MLSESSQLPSLESSQIEIIVEEDLPVEISHVSMADEDHLDPLLVELQIERERIDNVLENTIHRLNVAITLPFLVDDDGGLLRNFMDPEDVDIILEACDKYIPKLEIPGEQSENTSLILKSKDNWDVGRFDAELAEALEILLNYPPVYRIAANIFDQVDEESKTFISLMSTLKAFAVEKLHISAREERMHEMHLRTIYQRNEDAKEKIIALTGLLNDQRGKLCSEIEEKNNYISVHRANIEMMKKECMAQIEQRACDAERVMVSDWRGSNSMQVELQIEAKKVATLYESQLDKHLRTEKDLRVKRLKVETQLLGWIQKYDADMNERQNEFDAIFAEFEIERFALEDLQAEYDRQEVEYGILMEERRAYRQMVWEKKVSDFILYTAAWHIQRWFRAYLKDLADRRKKLKKAAKGKAKRSPIIKSAPAEVWTTPEATRQASIDSRRTSVSSRRASTVPLGVTNVRTEPRASITPRDDTSMIEEVEPKSEDTISTKDSMIILKH